MEPADSVETAVIAGTLDVDAPRPVEPRARPALTRRIVAGRVWPAVALVLALWALHRSFGPGLPTGTDITGHLERIQFGLTDLLFAGHLDGWFPRSMVGYEEFLLYGPGITWLVGALQLITFGLLPSVSALKIVIVAAFIAIPPAMAYLSRSLGLNRWASWAAGLLALTVSSDRGGGIEGVFSTGLVSQHVALPVLLIALGAIVRIWNGERGRTRIIAIGTVSFLLITHPPSLVLLAWLSLVVLAVLGLFEPAARGVRRGVFGLAPVALVVGGLTSWWLVPAIAHRDLTGQVTAFDNPGLGETLRLLFDGDRGYHGEMGRIALVAILAAAIVGLTGWRRPARRVALLYAVVGPVALIGALQLQTWLGSTSAIGLQLDDRGLVTYALLGLLPVAWLVSQTATTLADHWGAVGRSLVAAVVVVVGFKTLSPLAHRVATATPAPAMFTTAAYLHDHVPSGARFVVHDAPGRRYELGVETPARWLGWKADRDELNTFVPEVAPGPNLIRLVGTPLTPATVDAWVEQVRRLAVTHIVTWDDTDRDALETSPSVREVLRSGLIAVFAIIPGPGHPVGSLLNVTAITDQHVDDSGVSVTYTVTGSSDSEVAIGWSPKWHATVDGHDVRVRRSPTNDLLVSLPAGTHHLVLHFANDSADTLGLVITLATLSLLITRRYAPRRNKPSSLSPSSA
jgi:hypothetical protein